MWLQDKLVLPPWIALGHQVGKHCPVEEPVSLCEK